MAQVAAVILAAGLASRYRRADPAVASKVLADLDGRPMLRHVVDAALLSRAAPVVVITGHARDEVRHALADADVAFAHNPDFATGMASSLKRGIAALPPASEAAIILLADMPLVTCAIIDRLIERFVENRAVDAIAPQFAGVRGNPVLIARSLFAKVAGLEGDQGARPLLTAPGVRLAELPMDDLAVAADVDTPDALASLRARK